MASKSWAVMALLVISVIGNLDMKSASAAAATEAQCNLERRLAGKACLSVAYGGPPSPACCERVRVTHAECFCPLITPCVARFINATKARDFVEGCGRKVPHPSKCGSLTLP